MSTIKETIGTKGDVQNTAYTGDRGSQIEFGTPTHLLITDKEFKIPASQEFNLAYINQEIAKGNIIPLIGAVDFEDQSGDDTMQTRASGIERLNLRGLVKHKLIFESGNAYYRELSKLTSFKRYKAIPGDEVGNWKIAKNTDGTFGGFDLGQVLAERTMTKVQGGDNESKSVVLQYINRNQWDTEYEIYDVTKLAFYPSDIEGVNPVWLNITSALSNLDTTVVVDAKLLADKETVVDGFVAADFLVKVNGNTVTVSGAVESPAGTYTLTIPALSTNDVVTVETVNSSNNNGIVTVNDVMFASSETVSSTVA